MADVQVLKTKLEICITPQTAPLTAATFAALTYIPICCTSELPEFGTETEFLSEFCIDGTELTGIGPQTGMETEVSFYYKIDCAGQKFLRDNAGKNISYAVRKIYADETATTTPTTVYAQVKLGGYTDGGGAVEDFVTHTSSWKISQDPIYVEPAPI